MPRASADLSPFETSEAQSIDQQHFSPRGHGGSHNNEVRVRDEKKKSRYDSKRLGKRIGSMQNTGETHVTFRPDKDRVKLPASSLADDLDSISMSKFMSPKRMLSP